MTEVVLVDAADREIGRADKLEAHREGWLHRAVSVFVFDAAGRLLVQRRARDKYHSGGLWSNSACTHPLPGEAPLDAARRCLHEELGVTSASLVEAFTLTYRAPVSNALIEHELDHVFVGEISDVPAPSPTEVAAYRLESITETIEQIRRAPQEWTPWIALLAERVAQWREARGYRTIP